MRFCHSSLSISPQGCGFPQVLTTHCLGSCLIPQAREQLKQSYFPSPHPGVVSREPSGRTVLGSPKNESGSFMAAFMARISLTVVSCVTFSSSSSGSPSISCSLLTPIPIYFSAMCSPPSMEKRALMAINRLALEVLKPYSPFAKSHILL